MRRRHRRVLFNVFAFLFLGVAIYLNLFQMNDKRTPFNTTTRVIANTNIKPGVSQKLP